jgi:hypothetical protein
VGNCHHNNNTSIFFAASTFKGEKGASRRAMICFKEKLYFVLLTELFNPNFLLVSQTIFLFQNFSLSLPIFIFDFPNWVFRIFVALFC